MDFFQSCDDIFTDFANDSALKTTIQFTNIWKKKRQKFANSFKLKWLKKFLEKNITFRKSAKNKGYTKLLTEEEKRYCKTIQNKSIQFVSTWVSFIVDICDFFADVSHP